MTQAIDPDELDPTGELSAQIEAQRLEYGTYVANQRIHAGNALAYDVGHPVPRSNVVQHGYWFNGQVDLVAGAEHAPEIRAIVDARDAATEPAPGLSVDRTTPPIDEEERF